MRGGKRVGAWLVLLGLLGCARTVHLDPAIVSAKFSNWQPQVESEPKLTATFRFENNGDIPCEVRSYRVRWQGGDTTFSEPFVLLPHTPTNRNVRLGVGPIPEIEPTVVVLNVQAVSD
jgi:hypothetical protein